MDRQTAELVFDDCAALPDENVMGPLNGGVKVLMSGLDYERVVLSEIQLGIMQALPGCRPSLCERACTSDSERRSAASS